MHILMIEGRKWLEKFLFDERIHSPENFSEYLDRRITLSREEQMRTYFNFEIDEIMTVEKIIRATFSNP